MLFLALGAVDTRRSTRQRVLDELDIIQSSLNSLERAQCDTFVSERSDCMFDLEDGGACTDAFFIENCVAIQCVQTRMSVAACFGLSSPNDCCAPKAKKEHDDELSQTGQDGPIIQVISRNPRISISRDPTNPFKGRRGAL